MKLCAYKKTVWLLIWQIGSCLVWLGYTPGKNFFAAPYHWFLAEQGLEQFGYFEKIKTKIVAAYNGGYTSVAGAAAGDQQKANKRPKVVLIGHSLGTAVTIAFLQKTDPEFL